MSNVHIISVVNNLPSGKHTKNHGKSPFLMGKSTISMAMFCSSTCFLTKPVKNSGNLGPCDTGGRCWVQGWGTVLTTQSLFATDLELGGHLDDLKRKLMGMFDDIHKTGGFSWIIAISVNDEIITHWIHLGIDHHLQSK